MNAEDGVLWVVEIHSKKSGWRPAWEGEGANTDRAVCEGLLNSPDFRAAEVRVVKYVRAEG